MQEKKGKNFGGETNFVTYFRPTPYVSFFQQGGCKPVIIPSFYETQKFFIYLRYEYDL